MTFDEAALPITVKAIAYAANHNNSTVASKIITSQTCNWMKMAIM